MVDKVESVVRRSEVMAVIRVVRLGRVPVIGESLDYFIEVPCDERLGTRSVPQAKGRKPYRFEVEQWHLDAASLGTTPS